MLESSPEQHLPPLRNQSDQQPTATVERESRVLRRGCL